MHAEGDELDEEEHVGDGDAREEAVDGGAVHLLRGGTHMTSILRREGVKKSPSVAEFQYRVDGVDVHTDGPSQGRLQ